MGQQEIRTPSGNAAVRRNPGKGFIWWLVLTGLTAFSVGSLFRLRAATGSGLFGMLGTLGIVLAGYLGTQAIRAYSVAAAVEEYNRALERLPRPFEVFYQVFLPELGPQPWEPGDPYTGPANFEEVVLHPRAIFVPVLDHTDNQAALARVRRRLERSAERARRRARVLTDRLRARAGGAETLPVYGVLVLTRRRVDEAFMPAEILVTTVDGLTDMLVSRVEAMGPQGEGGQAYDVARRFLARQALAPAG